MPFSQRPLLIADHDEKIVENLRALLLREHFSVDAAPDGHAALRLLKTNWYSAVLLDLLLPRLNGFEVLRELKALHPIILKKVIVVTGASASTIACIGEFPVHGVIQKPVIADELLAMLGACTGTDRTSAMPAARLMRGVMPPPGTLRIPTNG